MFAISSLIHVVIGAMAARIAPRPSPECFMLTRRYLPKLRCLRLALLCCGVDMHVSHGWVSTAHTDAVVAETVDAYARAFDLLQDDPQFACAEEDAR
jgi:glutamate-1-semialdehyde 2,1-aminomutase